MSHAPESAATIVKDWLGMLKDKVDDPSIKSVPPFMMTGLLVLSIFFMVYCNPILRAAGGKFSVTAPLLQSTLTWSWEL